MFDRAFSRHVAPEWQLVTSLAELGDLGARWLDRSLPGIHPFGYTQLNLETLPLLDTLLAVNRLGYVTEVSQPGCSPALPWPEAVCPYQRAAVGGFVDRDLAHSLIKAADQAGLSTCVHYPEDRSDKSTKDIPVSKVPGDDPAWKPTTQGSDGLAEVTFFGSICTRRRFKSMFFTSPTVIEVLESATQLTIYDTEYGRNDRLWPMLDQFAAQSHPAR